jgi:hypothetical protein
MMGLDRIDTGLDKFASHSETMGEQVGHDEFKRKGCSRLCNFSLESAFHVWLGTLEADWLSDMQVVVTRTNDGAPWHQRAHQKSE